jgi:hypothetical protein
MSAGISSSPEGHSIPAGMEIGTAQVKVISVLGIKFLICWPSAIAGRGLSGARSRGVAGGPHQYVDTRQVQAPA